MRRAAVEPSTIVDFLTSTPQFAGCDRATLDKIAPHVYPVEVPAGRVIVRAGTPNPGIGFVASGAVRGPERCGPGEAFGETGAFLGGAQPHDVVAELDSVVYLLGHDVVRQLASKVAAFSFAVARGLARKITTSPPPLASTAPAAAAPALVPADDGIRFVRVSHYEPTPQIIAMVPARLIQQSRLLPLALRDHTLTIGMVDPTNTATRAELARVLTTTRLHIVAIAADDFAEAIVRFRVDAGRGGRGTRPPEVVAADQLVFDHADQEREAKQAGPVGDEIVQLANRLVAQAIERGASDVHVDHGVNGPRVRYRVQGQLHDWDHPIPANHARGLVSRLKVLAGLDVTERRLPQDGRLGVRFGRREVDLRISTIPTSRGEKVALRVFEASTMQRPLDAIFHDPVILEAVSAALQRPYGAIVVGGPTGSGKTSTLYAALGERLRVRPDTNVLTVEDPIEYRLAGVTQVQVNHAVDLGFAKVLRAMLRQDPDAIMVGEVRDDDTAQLALEAAMTGHLLLTSLHANNAVGALQRFEHLACPRPLIGQSVALVLVQRLARRLCARCVVSEVPPAIVRDNLAAHGVIERGAQPALPRAVGCPACSGTGYAGRVAVVEMLALDDALRAQIMAGAAPAAIERAALDAGLLVSFRRSALQLMQRQLISPAEALLTLA